MQMKKNNRDSRYNRNAGGNFQQPFSPQTQQQKYYGQQQQTQYYGQQQQPQYYGQQPNQVPYGQPYQADPNWQSRQQPGTPMGNGKSPRRKKNKPLRVILISLAVILVAIGGVYAYYISRYNSDVRVDQGFADGWDDISIDGSGPASLEDIEGNSDPIIRVKQKDKNIENILLLGVDGGDMNEAGHRSDSMMIVSVNKKDKTIKIASLMRDIWTYYPNRDSYNKLNAAYSFGGPGQTVNIINHNFDMDIQKYIVTDFDGLINLVDVLEGIKLEITDAEASEINNMTGGANPVSGGQATLSGSQALSFARIRKIDSDFSRVERQRKVIEAMLARMRSQTPQTQINTVNESMKYVRSNISGGELTGDMLNLVLSISSGIEQLTIPEEGMYTVNSGGTWYMELNWEQQVASLQDFIFG
jgi:LCP family protein required for cell wall assembly